MATTLDHRHDTPLYRYRDISAPADCLGPGGPLRTGLLYGRASVLARQAEALFMAQMGGDLPVGSGGAALDMAPDPQGAGTASRHGKNVESRRPCRPSGAVPPDAGHPPYRLDRQLGARGPGCPVRDVAAAGFGEQEHGAWRTAAGCAHGAELRHGGFGNRPCGCGIATSDRKSVV